jgi:diazepam-binding inhibitor (GABA receptor modulator, acyl-CoA-binding protein)
MADFIIAVRNSTKLKQQPTDTEKLALYGLYKQATLGDNKVAKPWSIQVRESAKWNAWKRHVGMSTKDAEKAYIKSVDDLIRKYGLA